MSRIPFALQTVFLQSQAGEDIEKIAPPTDGTAERAYPPTVPKARSSETKKEPKKKLGFKPATNRQTARSLKIFSRLGKHVTTAADATKAKLWTKKDTDVDMLDTSQELWIPKTVMATSTSESSSSMASPAASKKEFSNPQEYLDHELAVRGYSIKRFSSLQSGYHCPPNPLQLASFGNHLNQAVRTTSGQNQSLIDLLKVGVSPNACNKFGESIVHSVCRRGAAEKLQILLNYQCSVQVTDDYGRTPLHDACWQSDDPDFDTVRILLAIDKDLMFLTDIRGSTPLNYVKKDNHACWMEFLKTEIDHYWPHDQLVSNQRIPELVLEAAGSRPLPSQISNLGLDVISLLATGQLSATEPRLLMAVRPAGIMPGRVEQPEEAIKSETTPQVDDQTENTIDTTEEEDSDANSFDSYDSSEYDSDEDYDFDDGDLEEIIMIGNHRNQ